MELRTDVILDADPDLVWELLTRPDDLVAWLGAEVELDPTPGAAGRVVDHDGTVRHLVVEEVAPGERLRWRWWADGDDESTSRVEITLSPTASGTRVDVLEAPISPPNGPARARAGSTAWAGRLLDLEVLVLFAAVAIRS